MDNRGITKIIPSRGAKWASVIRWVRGVLIILGFVVSWGGPWLDEVNSEREYLDVRIISVARMVIRAGMKVDEIDLIINISAGRLIKGGVAIFEIISKNHHSDIIGE